jgi:hypothetical protein
MALIDEPPTATRAPMTARFIGMLDAPSEAELRILVIVGRIA